MPTNQKDNKDDKNKQSDNGNTADGTPSVQSPAMLLRKKFENKFENKWKPLAKEGNTLRNDPTSSSTNTNLDETFQSCLSNGKEEFVVRLAAAIASNPKLSVLIETPAGQKQLQVFVHKTDGLWSAIATKMKFIDNTDLQITKQINDIKTQLQTLAVFSTETNTVEITNDIQAKNLKQKIQNLTQQLETNRNDNNMKQLKQISGILRKEPTPKHNKPH